MQHRGFMRSSFSSSSALGFSNAWLLLITWLWSLYELEVENNKGLSLPSWSLLLSTGNEGTSGCARLYRSEAPGSLQFVSHSRTTAGWSLSVCQWLPGVASLLCFLLSPLSCLPSCLPFCGLPIFFHLLLLQKWKIKMYVFWRSIWETGEDITLVKMVTFH